MNNKEKGYNIRRHDLSNDRSLRAYSAADELLLKEFNGLKEKPNKIAIYNDRFGFLSCHLKAYDPTVIVSSHSQQRSIDINLKANELTLSSFANPLSEFEKEIDYAIIKVPKSLALFELFLHQIAHNSTKDVTVVIAFMTRHFSPKLIEISQKYFGEVKQSKALKKSRLATLTKKKEVAKLDIIDKLEYGDHSYKQYWGVFSAKHIDYATQYFLEHVEIKATDEHILDLASGNGVIGNEILRKLPNANMHLLDDSYLAVESAKLNVKGKNVHHHLGSDLSGFSDGTFELIVSNPPFHFEYEISINIPLELFKECFKCLKPGGNLQIVASKHLNYVTHLTSVFNTVEVIAENEKFTIYKCIKAAV